MCSGVTPVPTSQLDECLHQPGGGKKGDLPPELARLQTLLKRGLSNTAQFWSALQVAYGWVHQAAHILENHDELDGAGVRQQFEELLTTIRAQQSNVAPLADALAHFFKVTESYAPNLFHTYDKPGLPRTNNDLEHCFGSARDP